MILVNVESAKRNKRLNNVIKNSYKAQSERFVLFYLYSEKTSALLATFNMKTVIFKLLYTIELNQSWLRVYSV